MRLTALCLVALVAAPSLVGCLEEGARSTEPLAGMDAAVLLDVTVALQGEHRKAALTSDGTQLVLTGSVANASSYGSGHWATVALEVRDGSQVWLDVVENPDASVSARGMGLAILGDAVLAMGSLRDPPSTNYLGLRLLALDDGAPRWTAEHRGAGGYTFPTALSAETQERAFVAMTYEAEEGVGLAVLAYDAATGELLWKRTPRVSAGTEFGGAVHASRDGALVLATSGTNLFALDAATGEELWRTGFGDAAFAGVFHLTQTHALLLSSHRHDHDGPATWRVHAISLDAGATVWTTDLGETSHRGIDALSLPDGRIAVLIHAAYGPSRDGTLHVLDGATGAESGRIPLPQVPTLPYVLVDSDRLVLAGLEVGTVSKDGSPERTYRPRVDVVDVASGASRTVWLDAFGDSASVTSAFLAHGRLHLVFGEGSHTRVVVLDAAVLDAV